MNKSNKTLIGTIICLIACSFTSKAQYTLQDNDVVVENGIITKCTTDSINWGTGNIIIPATLDGQSVTTIGMSVFSNKFISTLTISNGITDIKPWAFFSNPLKNVFIPNSVVYIRTEAFKTCSLKSLTIPHSVKYIGSGAFANNYIHNIIIPNSVAYVGSYAFEYNGITSLTFENGSNIRVLEEGAFYDASYSNFSSFALPANANPGFSGYRDEDGNKYGAGYNVTNLKKLYYADLPPYTLTKEDVTIDGNEIKYYTGTYSNIIIPGIFDGINVTSIASNAFIYHRLTSVAILDGITSVNYTAFSNNYISNLTLPNTLTYIASGAFMSNRLDTLIIPNSVTGIGGDAFMDNMLKSVTISNQLNSIEMGLFQNNSFDSISIPDNITTISEDAFRSNTLKKLSLNRVISVGSRAFMNNSLQYVAIPNSVTTIGNDAFANNSLDSVALSNNLTQISDGLFRNNSLDIIKIPNKINSIGDSAFCRNGLKSIYIPNRVAYIGKKAFADNFALSTIQLPNPVVKEGYTFSNWQNNADSTIVTQISDFSESYKALLSINRYNVIFTSKENGRLSGDSIQKVEFGGNATEVWAVANSNFHFIKWVNKGSGDSVTNKNPITLVSIVADTALVAIFAKNKSTSIKSINTVNVNVYPNPIVDYITVETPEAIQMIEIYNATGEKKYSNCNIRGTSVKINLQNYCPGVYFVLITGKNINQVKKIVVRQ